MFALNRLSASVSAWVGFGSATFGSFATGTFGAGRFAASVVALSTLLIAAPTSCFQRATAALNCSGVANLGWSFSSAFSVRKPPLIAGGTSAIVSSGGFGGFFCPMWLIESQTLTRSAPPFWKSASGCLTA